MRVQVLLTVLLVSTNLVGAGIVFVLSTLVIPSPPPNDALTLALAIGVPVYVGVAVVIGASLGHRSRLRALRWATEEQTPTREERLTALRRAVVPHPDPGRALARRDRAVHRCSRCSCSPSAR